MTQLSDLAGHLLRVEQQLIAYQKLHTDELAELWRTLNECKCTLITLLPSQESGQYSEDSPAVNEELKR